MLLCSVHFGKALLLQTFCSIETFVIDFLTIFYDTYNMGKKQEISDKTEVIMKSNKITNTWR